MAEFRRGWAVVVRDTTPVEGFDAWIVRVLRVFWSEDDARAEVTQLSESDTSDERHYYYEATEVEQP